MIPMAKKAKRPKKSRKTEVETADYRHSGQKRKNNPPATMAGEGTVPKVARVQYQYSPHLPPALRSDPTGKKDKVPELLAQAGKRPLMESEQKLLAEALGNQQPWLEWAGKQEQHKRGFFEVDPVALHIHERISTQAMVRVLERKDIQRDLFADPQQPYAQAVQFYRHDVDWANRIILGDSLQVMVSLARREDLSGKVQMVYIDPPYGISFKSNFQSLLGDRDVKDRDQDLTREAEMVRAYRDTWTLGIHSYLAYLRDRFIAAKELLTDSGSVFVQISDENVHRVRCVMDEVFGSNNFVSMITFRTTANLVGNYLGNNSDYLLWYSRDISRLKYRQVYKERGLAEDIGARYTRYELPDYSRHVMAREERGDEDLLPKGAQPYRHDNLSSQGATESGGYRFGFNGIEFKPSSGRHWTTALDGMTRLAGANRLAAPSPRSLGYVRYLKDFPVAEFTSVWSDTATGAFTDDKVYVVQTNTKVIERCLLMTTDPGDLVLDPTCGSGTTAYVAEQWGRRWITGDTSRVALALARQRLMTARFPYYRLRAINAQDAQHNPGPWISDPSGEVVGKGTFACKTVPHVTLKSIARNTALDPIVARHEANLSARLQELNASLKQVTTEIRHKLAGKLAEKQKRDGKKSVTDADRRRWDLPKTQWLEWEVPFDSDPDWPSSLQDALAAYRAAWVAKMDEVNACIASNAEMEELVDKPEIVNSIVRVTGPFTVEGVRPEEMSLGQDGLFDPTPDQSELDTPKTESDDGNLPAYLSQMVQHLRADGVTFLGNHRRRFSRVDAIFEQSSGSLIHAEGTWEDGDANSANTIGVSFGPPYGPVTAMQVEEAIRESRQYKDLVIAGFSFDAEASAVVAEKSHPRLRVHAAWIRPDLNQAMEGLLKDTPNSQLFTVFGQPEVDIKATKDGFVCILTGVDIYNPIENTVLSSGADKVAAWFLDSDFDGRCFCITQAFFPDQNAWEKIAKALGTSADPDAFEAFKGTKSLPFPKGKYGRIAVKVIDPRGNEVMAIRKLD
jgi:adenine-specific DNA-methyltransferase